MKKTTIILFAIGLVLSSCNNDKKIDDTIQKNKPKKEQKDTTNTKKINLRKKLIGRWENRDMTITVNSFNGLDTSYTTTLTGKDQWEDKLGINSVITEYKKDGTYIVYYYDFENNPIRTTEGTWDLIGNMLILKEHGKLTRYDISIKDNFAIMESIIDWDEDGNIDDRYIGSFIRQ